MVFGLGTAAIAIATVPQPEAFAVVDGERKTVGPGTVVARGTHNDNGTCFMPEFTVGGSLTRHYTSGEIDVEANENCEWKVTRVVFGQITELPVTNGSQDGVDAVPQKAPSSAPTDRQGLRLQGALAELILPKARAYHPYNIRGLAESYVHDQVDIEVTETYTELEYWDDLVDVYDGGPYEATCWGLASTGWEVESCFAFWDPDGPDHVWLYTEGEYVNPEWSDPLGRDWYHWTRARVDAWPNFDFDYTCTTSSIPQGPPALHKHCSGAQQMLNH
jgi:hypothetical protein